MAGIWSPRGEKTIVPPALASADEVESEVEPPSLSADCVSLPHAANRVRLLMARTASAARLFEMPNGCARDVMSSPGPRRRSGSVACVVGHRKPPSADVQNPDRCDASYSRQ